MSFFQALFLGLIQGLTEFLPVSSSGHLVLFESLFGLESAESSNLLFDVLLHFGTLIAVVIAFHREIGEMLAELWRMITSIGGRSRNSKKESVSARRLIILIVVGTIPLFAALPFKSWLEGIRGMPWVVGVALIVTSLLLFVADRFRKGRKTERGATATDALIIGLMQCVALIPGISRSGSTITMGLFRGFDRKFAVRFSFLLSLPAVLGATILELADALKEGIDTSLIPTYLAGMLVAGFSGFFAIKFVKYVADKGRFGWFAIYCFIAGAATVIISLAA